MSEWSTEWDKEQRRVNEVIAAFKKRIAKYEPNVGELRTEVVDFRTNFWDDVTVNLSNDDDILETFMSMKQQAQILSEREHSHRHLLNQLKRTRRLLPSPYFGRIDFHEKGTPASEKLYIGVASFLADDDETFLVYDWRTPIASLYYDFPPGPAAYNTPGGEISGTIELKRQFSIRDGVIRTMFDTGMTIGDELLQNVLSKGAGSQMQSIVATIQQEQNQIIRNDSSRLLVVQGAAGSGKTSAALQRAAYLLYKHRERLTAEQMVLFSPNPMFNSYVATVLPELGEDNIQQTTFQEYLNRRLGSSFDVEDPFDQMEYVLTKQDDPDYDAVIAGIAFKASSRFLHLMRGYRDRLLTEGMKFRGIRFKGRTVLSRQAIETQFYNSKSAASLSYRIDELKDWILQQLRKLERAERSAEWVKEELDYLDQEQYQDAFNRLAKRQQAKNPAFDDAQQEEELLREGVVRTHFRPLYRKVRALRFVDTKGLYRQLFEDDSLVASLLHENEALSNDPSGFPNEELWKQICARTIRLMDEGKLAAEDATPYLYLKELIEGFQMNGSIRYVLMDEAQDYSAFQFEFVKRLFPRARMTVLGDFNQAIFAQASDLHERSGSPLEDLYGPDDTAWLNLTRSYRSTREIVDFTRAMLADGNRIVPFDRTGGKPIAIQCLDAADRDRRIVEDIAALQAEGYGSIAIITKSQAEAIEAYERLRSVPAIGESLRLVNKTTPQFEHGLLIIPAYLAKGVEFDAVLIYDASASCYGRESERKLFYTACTRPMHRLRMYNPTDAWSLFVVGVSEDLYEKV
ncbi:Rep family ATP-dependent DNA helicase [Paenibacillus cellulosilyticus]|uniref:Rep family ATP-dependent DNA helicase n=1 Tax=Paenibacillus cellulosilyticus TaxID=375489 RepID=A0A2V2YXM1_9BACL|nr:RNA polymerase recycling motor HelD [Paenibacillus cellulosilyticus]PWW06578.1 Rep family ATP-dependent DNA helicase [Paenibacillus cellulosilyticus]QKS46090.1 UvrD-helicase domain-containing protein [Paenibacillus cellulosilyticus]